MWFQIRQVCLKIITKLKLMAKLENKFKDSTDFVMSITERKSRNLKLKEFHQATLDHMEVSDAVFMGKTDYFDPMMKMRVMPFFESELKAGVDIYTERTDKQLRSEDLEFPDNPRRELLRWNFRDDWRERYVKNSKSQYLIPMDEMQVIEKVKPKNKIGTQTILDITYDAPLSQMTIVDFYAMIKDIPMSSKSWINDMITEYNRNK